MAPRRKPNPELTVLDKLTELALVRAELAEAQLAYEEELTKILAPVQAELDLLDAQANADLAVMESLRDTLEAEIKLAVKALGYSVKGSELQAVYLHGRACWNNDALEGYAATHQEILPFRSFGEPSVSIRAVKRIE
jgi:hypothetical protein